MPSNRKIKNLVQKLDAAAAAAQVHADAILLAHDAFFEAFGVPVPYCCSECAECSGDSSLVKLETLFWDFVNTGESEQMKSYIYSTEIVVDMMERLMNEAEIAKEAQ